MIGPFDRKDLSNRKDLSDRKVLLKGYGNPAREDDGLGPAVAEELERLHIAGLTVDVDYQLSVEDSAALAEHDTVIFVDASIDGKEPYSFSRVKPKRQESFSSHSVSPEAVFYLARELFGARSDVYVLAVRGYSFNMFTEEMTAQARKNMREAVNFLVSILHTGIFQEF